MVVNTYLHPQTYIEDNESKIYLYSINRFYCITDRNQDDVDRVKYLTNAILSGTNTEMEFLEFQQNLRGALNYSDLDRIEGNLRFLADLFKIDLVDMSRDVIPRVPYFKKLLINVQRIRDLDYHFSDTPQVPEMPLNTYSKINDIEKILLHAYASYYRNSSDNVRVFCGESMYADNNVLI